jgi:hypothetical protein
MIDVCAVVLLNMMGKAHQYRSADKPVSCAKRLRPRDSQVRALIYNLFDLPPGSNPTAP